ncbi:sugar ABC transporter ATP-binding protein [Pseudoflavonifractor sp. AF19-9AC]|uniref:sugar ABC transporter ATP-binding protein n=1 Tax=Pseudoflavonifractor sp. AF19-9AC TaxID=2292244 RepID=UPI000E48C4F3|nr:sugar ABC transporter ATP-binding protein [Pseudoflavonifractor sp. AF19-9AC]RHR06841.1 sugar ABC transporter ATP-binding protein [Pseudoflavonifractor sp. AF19-9AC]
MTASSGVEKLLSVRNVYKSFGLNAVLKGISLDLAPGEVLALIGGNGAGKSTLMKIIMGIYSHDSGEIFVDGKEMTVGKPAEALAHGVYMVPQEPLLFPNMTVEENILIGFDRPRAELRRELVERMDNLGWHIALERKASSLSIAEQQLVEILRGLLRHAKVLILDEPTSALTFKEVESLFKCVEDLKSQGIGIIYITHRLNEVFEIATTVAIMRDGVITLDGPVSDFTRDDLVCGLLPTDSCQRKTQVVSKVDYSKPPVFELRNFSGYGFTDISLKVYPGEILGLAGVVGAGRTEMAMTIFGRDKVLGGNVILDGKDITGLKTADVIKAGLNYVPEDRHADGLFKISDVACNTTSALLSNPKMGRFFLNRKEEKKVTQQYVDDFRIKVTGQDQLTGSLSGGNQQKIVIGRSLSTAPKLVILDEPTRGIDAAARGDVYSIIHQLRDQGVSILLISSDMEEIVELSDRAMSIYLGRVNCEFAKEDVNQDNLTSAAFGLIRKEEEKA